MPGKRGEAAPRVSGAAYLTVLSLCLKSDLFCARNSEDRARKEVRKVSRRCESRSSQPWSLCAGVCVHTLLWVRPHHVPFPCGVLCLPPSGTETGDGSKMLGFKSGL